MPKRRVPRHEVVQPLDQSIRLIPLTQGQNAIVDAEDFQFVSGCNWYAKYNKCTKSFYAATKPRSGILYMHRMILGVISEQQVDHKNHDTLDNRRQNLRSSTRSQNRFNVSVRNSNRSGFKGVSLRSDGKKWICQIAFNKKRVHIGCFSSPEEAAIAYNEAAKTYHGEFAYLNVIQ